MAARAPLLLLLLFSPLPASSLHGGGVGSSQLRLGASFSSFLHDENNTLDAVLWPEAVYVGQKKSTKWWL